MRVLRTWMTVIVHDTHNDCVCQSNLPQGCQSVDLYCTVQNPTCRWATVLDHICFAGNKVAVSFGDWDKLIQANFENHFYISTAPDPKSESAPALINRRGIYKDVVGASQVWTDYQLRPNFTIALVVVSASCCGCLCMLTLSKWSPSTAIMSSPFHNTFHACKTCLTKKAMTPTYQFS